MPTFAAFLASLDNNPRGRRGLHACLQNVESFVYFPPTAPNPPSGNPSGQIVIEASSMCSVSYGGSR